MNRSRTYAMGAAFVLLLVAAALLAMRRVAEVRSASVPWGWPLVDRDLEAIDTLRVLVLRDPLTWEQRPKAVSGLEHDLLLRFAQSAGLPLVAIPMDHPDSMFMALQRGDGDIIAAQLTKRRDQRHWLAFTAPYRYVRPVLAMLRPDPLMGPARGGAQVDVPVDTVEISPWSAFADPDYDYDRTLGKVLEVHAGPVITPEDLLMEVVMGRHRATVITDARATHEAGRFPVLEFGAPIGPERGLRFAVRRNAPALLKALDDWLDDPAEREAREQFVKAYAVPLPRPGPLRMKKAIPVTGDSISPFDDHFRMHASLMRWDWELLAAMAWKESRFDSTATSRKGAQGIMQIMPRTGKRLGLDSASVMGDHIRAAVLYLGRLDTLWMRAIPDREQRLRFVLASYNAGPGHIIDAQRLARLLGLDPDRWEHNVERAVLLLSKPRYYMLPEMKNGYCKGSQVFHYVRDVVHMYRQLKVHQLPSSNLLSRAGPDSGGA